MMLFLFRNYFYSDGIVFQVFKHRLRGSDNKQAVQVENSVILGLRP